MACSLKPSITKHFMSCVILESILKKGEHVCNLETKESTEVVELDPTAVDRDEDVYCSLSGSSEVQATTFSSGTRRESDVQSFLSRSDLCIHWTYQEVYHRS